jgi:hypothetical protein
MESGGGVIRDRGAHVMSTPLWWLDAEEQPPALRVARRIDASHRHNLSWGMATCGFRDRRSVLLSYGRWGVRRRRAVTPSSSLA